MKNIYAKVSEKTFRIISAFLCLSGDLLVSKFIYDKFDDKEKFDQALGMVIDIYRQQGIEIPNGIQNEVYKMLISSLLLMIGLFICVHVINYIFFVLYKRFAYAYTKFLSITAFVGFLLMGMSLIGNSAGWGSIFVLQSLFYFLVFYGIKLYPFKLSEES